MKTRRSQTYDANSGMYPGPYKKMQSRYVLCDDAKNVVDNKVAQGKDLVACPHFHLSFMGSAATETARTTCYRVTHLRWHVIQQLVGHIQCLASTRLAHTQHMLAAG
jgi:hypothetical protein